MIPPFLLKIIQSHRSKKNGALKKGTVDALMVDGLPEDSIQKKPNKESRSKASEVHLEDLSRGFD
jgi:hypothetical protein